MFPDERIGMEVYSARLEFSVKCQSKRHILKAITFISENSQSILLSTLSTCSHPRDDDLPINLIKALSVQ